ncbi:MAG: hypothetical protein HKM90_10905 [Desulfobacteraceae bacterium]|nr:hypothetical protein [Desulfobacteraceae bacterium]
MTREKLGFRGIAIPFGGQLVFTGFSRFHFCIVYYSGICLAAAEKRAAACLKSQTITERYSTDRL